MRYDKIRFVLCHCMISAVWVCPSLYVCVCVCMLCVFAIIMRCHVLCLTSFSDRKLIV